MSLAFAIGLIVQARVPDMDAATTAPGAEPGMGGNARNDCAPSRSGQDEARGTSASNRPAEFTRPSRYRARVSHRHVLATTRPVLSKATTGDQLAHALRAAGLRAGGGQ